MLHCTVASGQGLADTGTWEFLFTKPSQKGQVRRGRWLFYCLESSWLFFKAGARKCHTTLSLHGALINKRDTTARRRGWEIFPYQER